MMKRLSIAGRGFAVYSLVKVTILCKRLAQMMRHSSLLVSDIGFVYPEDQATAGSGRHALVCLVRFRIIRVCASGGLSTCWPRTTYSGLSHQVSLYSGLCFQGT